MESPAPFWTARDVVVDERLLSSVFNLQLFAELRARTIFSSISGLF
jgi:hypothetical protein